MKQLYTICISLFLLFILNSSAVSQNFFVEDFNYAPCDSLEGFGGWFRSGVNSDYNVKIVSPGLSYTGYDGSGKGNAVFFSNPSTGGDIVLHNFITQTVGSLFISFLIRVDTLMPSATNGYNICFDQSGGTTANSTRLYVQKLTANTFKFGVAKRSEVTYMNAACVTHNTFLVVLKYAFVSGADNDSTKMYVFGSGVPASEPPVPDAIQLTGTDMVDIGQLSLNNSYAQTGLKYSSVTIDGIRIGKTWQTSILHSSIRNISNEIPEKYKLHQNYPNPFNPSTNLKFEIVKAGDVKLVVYDLQGREVQTLVNERLQPGTYETSFDGSKLTSGVYFYKLTSDGFSETRKMILLK